MDKPIGTVAKCPYCRYWHYEMRTLGLCGPCFWGQISPVGSDERIRDLFRHRTEEYGRKIVDPHLFSNCCEMLNDGDQDAQLTFKERHGL